MYADPDRPDILLEGESQGVTEIGGRPGTDPLSWFSWASILIWAGFVLMFKNLGETLGVEPENAAAWILTGAGVVFWLEAILRLAMPKYRGAVGERRHASRSGRSRLLPHRSEALTSAEVSATGEERSARRPGAVGEFWGHERALGRSDHARSGLRPNRRSHRGMTRGRPPFRGGEMSAWMS